MIHYIVRMAFTKHYFEYTILAENHNHENLSDTIKQTLQLCNSDSNALIIAAICCVVSKQFLRGHTCHALVISSLCNYTLLKNDNRIDHAVAVSKKLISTAQSARIQITQTFLSHRLSNSLELYSEND